MLRITGYIMNFAPIAVFAAMAATITTQGLGVLITYGKFMLEFYLSLAILWCVLALAGYALMGRAMSLHAQPDQRAIPARLLHRSSEAAYPKTLVSSKCSACRTASPASSCRWATRSISMAR